MRWVLIGLLTLNVSYMLWGGLEYAHNKKVISPNVIGEIGADMLAMPGEKLILIKEGGHLQDRSDISLENSEIEASNSVSKFCTLVGVVKDADTGHLLTKRLLALGIRGQLKSLEVPGEPDYWVYLKPEISRELALARLRELQDKKIDSFIIPEGGLMNGISLGVFDEEVNAQAYMKKMADMGYKAEITTNKRVYLESWVLIDHEDAGKLNNEMLVHIDIQSRSLEIRKELCSKVASLTDIH